jgi:hypothetical protein
MGLLYNWSFAGNTAFASFRNRSRQEERTIFVVFEVEKEIEAHIADRSINQYSNSIKRS